MQPTPGYPATTTNTETSGEALLRQITDSAFRQGEHAKRYSLAPVLPRGGGA